MGSALSAEPLGALVPDAVLCSLSNPDLVAHRRHVACAIETPHTINDCGRFHPVAVCPLCGRRIAVRRDGRLFRHHAPNGEVHVSVAAPRPHCTVCGNTRWIYTPPPANTYAECGACRV